MKHADAHITELLQAGLTAMDIEDSRGVLKKYLLRYIHELEIFNAAFNLVKVENTEDLVIKHIFDSLAPWKLLAEKIDSFDENRPCTFADIGSGAGFPGIPLACLFLIRNPEVEFTLIERMNKRCAVLENVRAVMGLTNTAILEVEAEKAPKDYFDIAVFRAFRPLDRTILKTVQGRIRKTGLLAAYKGKRAAIEEELAALGTEKPAYRIIPVTVPFCDAERNVVIIEKGES
ncbi:MAG: 16S rRNA (guanine(527)-N(7))-methyltransferase RsmG [Treponema sp.]